MPWVYLDDGFPDHPKVEAAGGDAGWLYVVALCFARRNRTGGKIPKARVARLTDRRQPVKLAGRLVEVGLWEDAGDSYQIHDYERWNQTEAKERRARQAAEARWAPRHAGAASGNASSNASGTPPSNALGIAERTPGGIASGNASSNASGNARAMPHTRAPHSPIPIPSSSSPSDSGTDRPAGDDDDDLEAKIEAACRLLAAGDLRRRTAEKGPVAASGPWLERATRRRRSQHGSAATALLAAEPGLTVDELVGRLAEPERAPRPPTPEEVTAAARAQLLADNDARRANPCPSCAGVGQVEPDPVGARDVWAPCPACAGSGIASAAALA
jgi:hypothetical protein